MSVALWCVSSIRPVFAVDLPGLGPLRLNALDTGAPAVRVREGEHVQTGGKCLKVSSSGAFHRRSTVAPKSFGEEKE